MPYISVRTSKKLSEEEKTNLKAELGKAIALFPGKSESWLMVDLADNDSIYFQGIKGDCAFVEVKLYGGVDKRSADGFTAEVCRLLGAAGIPSDRVYVRYQGGTDWGWNGNNF